ncbi:MAG: sulfotransferase [Fidelibacterota bacterium]
MPLSRNIGNTKKRLFRKAKIEGFRLLKSPLKGHRPDFIVIGAQKSGTSSLHYYLSQHPRLRGSLPKEIHYFDKWIHYGYDIKWYESHFKSFSRKNSLYFESSPNYIYYEETAKLLHEHYPGIKLILMLRDPAERAYSAWNMYRDMYMKGYPDFSKREGRHPGETNAIYRYLMKDRDAFPSFGEAIDIEMELIRKKGPAEPAILRRGFYADQLKNYLKYFSGDQIHIIGFKDFTDHPQKVLKEVYQFLGVEAHDKVKTPVKSKGSYRSSPGAKEKTFLADLYSDKNEALFTLINKKINW